MMSLFDYAQGKFGQGGGLAMGQNTGLDNTATPSLWNPDLSMEGLLEGREVDEEKMPRPPNTWQGDPSGFAEYGMKPPPLQDPIQQIGGLMALATADHNKPRQRTPIQQGGLMGYLNSLGMV